MAVEFTNLPTNTLVWFGTMNKHLRDQAIKELASRGMNSSVHFLEVYESHLKHGSHMELKSDKPRSRTSWLASTPTGPCVDCNHTTSRKFNGYWQCHKCGQEIKAAGSRDKWKDLKLMALLKKRAEDEARQKEKAAQKAETSQAETPALVEA